MNVTQVKLHYIHFHLMEGKLTVNTKSKMNIKEIVDIVWKEIGFPDTEEKQSKMASRVHELMILRELLV